ncbi:MAG: hypothetical protein K1X89_26930, partial [Myxococcaceae bacterium]|nr:hypothetical protein [Myxococcaceae bacterium]
GGGSAGGGSASGGGSAGGGAPDAGFYGASRCSTAGVRFCEDFETGGFSPGTWTQLTKNGTLTIDSTHVARGNKAMHVHVVNEAGNFARIRNLTQFKPTNYPGKVYFGRVFGFVTPAASTVHNSFIGTVGTLPNPDGGTSKLTSVYAVDMVNQAFVSHFGLREAGTVLYDTGARSTKAVPLGAWHCWEWKWDGQNNEEHFWLDEVEVLDAAVLPNKHWYAPQPFDSLEIGLRLYHTEDAGFTAYDVWFDELALDDQRIGCRR